MVCIAGIRMGGKMKIYKDERTIAYFGCIARLCGQTTAFNPYPKYKDKNGEQKDERFNEWLDGYANGCLEIDTLEGIDADKFVRNLRGKIGWLDILNN